MASTADALHRAVKTSFYPHQLGVGILGGCEAAIHSARRYPESIPANHVLVIQ